MKNKVLWNFSLNNMKANKTLQIPFILSSGLMFALFYIMNSLLFNSFVRTRHETLPLLISFGNIVIALFTFIFILYANRFLTKRRNKEFALYGILGLEKKHIAKILRIEQLVNFISIGILGVFGGYLIGKILFLILNTIMQDKSAGLMDYPFEPKAAVITLAALAVFLVFIYVLNMIKVRISNPIELLNKQKSSDKEPKSKWLIMILGLICIGTGYYIALTTKGLFDAMLLFFLAVLLVIAGTYFLFISLTIIVLKAMRKNKSYYYRANNFLSVSGMLYRMKANAVGLASIFILCTGIIITLGTTLTVYKGIDNIVNTTMKAEYSIEDTEGYTVDDSIDKLDDGIRRLRNTIENTNDKDIKINDLNISRHIFIPAAKKRDKLLVLDEKNMKRKLAAYYMKVTVLDDYNAGKKESLHLKDDEVYMTANIKELREADALILSGDKYRVKALNDEVAGNIAVGSYLIVVKDYEQLVKLADYYRIKDMKSGSLVPAKIYLEANWNPSVNSNSYEDSIKENIKDTRYRLESRKSFEKQIYSLNGGFLFLGMVIGAVLLIGTVLITYYKQVSEGYEDRENYQIMKKVGLPDELISSTSNKQIVWMFFLPLMAAGVHTLAASKILYNLLGIFGIHSLWPFISSLLLVTGIFAVAYLLVFAVTSKIYYTIVS